MNEGYLYIRMNPTRAETPLEIGVCPSRPERVSPDHPPTDAPRVIFDAAVPDMRQAEAVIRSILGAHRSEEDGKGYRLPVDDAVRTVRDVAERLHRIAVFRRAAAAEPDNAAAFNNLGCGLDGIGDHGAAIEAFKRAVALDGTNPVFFSNLGCNYGKLGLYRKAIDAFREAIRLRPDFIKAHFDLGFSYGKLGRHRQAADAFQRAIAIDPGVAQLHYHLGHACARLGLQRDSLRAFAEAVRVNPNHVNAHYRLGLAHLRARNREAALKQYRILRSLDDEKSLRLFRRIYRQYGHPETRSARSS